MFKRVSCTRATGALHDWISIHAPVGGKNQATTVAKSCLGRIDSRIGGNQAGFDADSYGNRGVRLGYCSGLSNYGRGVIYDYVETHQGFGASTTS